MTVSLTGFATTKELGIRDCRSQRGLLLAIPEDFRGKVDVSQPTLPSLPPFPPRPPLRPPPQVNDENLLATLQSFFLAHLLSWSEHPDP